jgi:acyl carrier protein
MTAKTEIADRLRAAIGKELKRDPSTIEAHHSLREDLGLNSLDAIELMFKVEEEFDLSIPDADLQKLVTVGDLLNYIDERLHLSLPKTSPKPAVRASAKRSASRSAPKAAKPKGQQGHV